MESLIEDNANAAVSDKESPEDAKTRLLAQLRSLDEEEKQAYDNIFSSPLPEALMPHLKKWWDGEKAEHLEDVDLEAFFKQPSFCHSAILPSEARFRGLVTENSAAVGTILDQNYEEGVSSGKLFQQERSKSMSFNDDDKILMVRDDGGRQQCDEYLNLDYKDYFFVSNREGWRSVTLPNDAERNFYTEFDGANSKGYILLCLVRVSWNRRNTPDRCVVV